MKCIFWDVQHGSAATVVTPNNKYIAIDLGTGSYGDKNSIFSPLLHLKNKHKVDRLNTVIITHPHRDHLDDIHNFDELDPHTFLRPKHLTEEEIRKSNRDSDKNVVDVYLDICKRYSETAAADKTMKKPENMGGVKIQTFHPRNAATSNINNHSIVTVISYAESKLLFPGDNEPVSWKELLEKSDFLEAIKGTDIFVAPHHGRESGFCTELFEHIKPKLVIISDGRFCDTSATDRYSKKASGWKVYKNSGDSVERKCLTTRNDGVITVQFGMNETKRFIQVTIG